MVSCVYEGRVRHRRFRPVSNAFSYRLFMMYLDLSELKTVFEGRWLWSNGHVNLAYFRRRDHLGDPRIPLDRAVRDLVYDRSGKYLRGPIRMLTHLRYFGHCFNPVSFYYCYDQSGRQVETIVAEIHNTPWGEEYVYVLGKNMKEHAVQEWKRYQFAKAFHVSPFMGMNIQYDWRFREPGQRISVHFDSMEKGRKVFDATLSLRRRGISGPALARVLLLYPVITLKVTGRIYWQALRLKLKGAPFYVHPKKRPAQREHRKS